jgi:NitT/TauT family transport system permease protein
MSHRDLPDDPAAIVRNEGDRLPAHSSPRRPPARLPGAVLLPLAVGGAFLLVWDLIVRLTASTLFPKPSDVALAIAELVRQGLLFKYIVASLFRVTCGFTLAALVGVPSGLLLGWFRRASEACNPMIQLLRPISPIAWIPLAILWFGVSDAAPIFLIFLASVFPITVSTMAAVKSVQLVHLRAAQNFGLTGMQLFRRVILPATVPQILTSLRIALGIAWLVVVAAEMIALRSGLGYLIIDSRNAGNRYDLVIAGMIIIGLIGLMLDRLMRMLEGLKIVRWRYAH